MNINYFNNDYFVSKYINSDIEYLDLENNTINTDLFNDNFIKNYKHKTFSFELTSSKMFYEYTCSDNYDFIEIRACIFVKESDIYATPLNYETLNTININGIEYKFYNNYMLDIIIPIPANKIIKISKSTYINLFFYSFFTEFNY